MCGKGKNLKYFSTRFFHGNSGSVITRIMLSVQAMCTLIFVYIPLVFGYFPQYVFNIPTTYRRPVIQDRVRCDARRRRKSRLKRPREKITSSGLGVYFITLCRGLRSAFIVNNLNILNVMRNSIYISSKNRYLKFAGHTVSYIKYYNTHVVLRNWKTIKLVDKKENKVERTGNFFFMKFSTGN